MKEPSLSEIEGGTPDSGIGMDMEGKLEYSTTTVNILI